MGINDEYSRDAYLGDHYAYDSDDSDDFDQYLDEESWQDMYSEELIYAWEHVQEYVYDNYLVLDRDCTYPRFVAFVMEPHQLWPSSSPSAHAEQIWNKIKRTPAIAERVTPGHFFTWFDSQLI
jgi:hypothetical protein